MSEKNFYQQFMKEQMETKDVLEVKVDGFPVIFLKNPDVKDIKNSGVMKGKAEEIEIFIVEYMLVNLFEDEGMEKRVFTDGNKDQLMRKWSKLHSKVLEVFSNSVTESVGNVKED